MTNLLPIEGADSFSWKLRLSTAREAREEKISYRHQGTFFAGIAGEFGRVTVIRYLGVALASTEPRAVLAPSLDIRVPVGRAVFLAESEAGLKERGHDYELGSKLTLQWSMNRKWSLVGAFDNREREYYTLMLLKRW